MNPEFVRTICPYCGVGCGIIIKIENGAVVGTYPDREHPVSKGTLCLKGWSAHEFIHHPERLKTPLLKKGDGFQAISWNEAIALASEKLKTIAEQYGGDAIGGLCSAKCTNEENYLFQKLIRSTFKTNNVDHCARLCHAPTAAGLAQTTGSGAMTNSVSDLAEAECIIITGSNPAESHPVLSGELYKAIDRGAKVIVIDPRSTPVVHSAHLHLRIIPGTDIPLLCGMMKHIIDSGLHNIKFIEERTEGFAELKSFLENWHLKKVAEECGIKEEIIKEVAELYAKAKDAAIVYCMGITQHACGTANVFSISDLAILCGHIGKKYSGLYPLRGQNNVQGSCDMGGLPNLYPGYQSVADNAAREKFQKAWGRELSPKPGLTVTEMTTSAGKNVRGLYIMAENPAISDPDVNHVMESLDKLDFLIVQDIFLTETAKHAHLILPAACFAEKDGTYTNTERRVQLIRRAIDPPGEAKSDFEILCLMGRALGLDYFYDHPKDVMEEISAVVPAFGGIRYERLKPNGLQWPCPSLDHPGTRFLHEGKFTRGKGLFIIPQYTPPFEKPDKDYPYYLNTGRMFVHYHTGSMTRRSDSLNAEQQNPYAEINPADAADLKIRNGDRIKITSRRGSIVTTARITEAVAKGCVFAPFHFSEARANILTNPVLDPIAKIPELKVCAVRVEKEPYEEQGK